MKVSTSGILRTKNYFLFYFIKGWKGFWENPIWTQKTSITKKKKIIIILIYLNLMEQVLTRSPLAGKASCLILSTCELFLSNDSPPCVWNIGFGADILAVSCVCFPILWTSLSFSLEIVFLEWAAEKSRGLLSIFLVSAPFRDGW